MQQLIKVVKTKIIPQKLTKLTRLRQVPTLQIQRTQHKSQAPISQL